ncbi:hypothetical protein [Sphingomonas gilva]|nr:hypothetical protein [Sphingomonas gilva]
MDDKAGDLTEAALDRRYELDYSPGEVQAMWTPPAALFQGALAVGRPPRLIGKSTGVTGEHIQLNAESRVRARICVDDQSLTMSLDLKIGGGVVIVDTGSAESKLQLISSIGVSNYDVTIVVYAKHVPGSLFAKGARLLPGVRPGTQGFVDYYGGAWVSKITHGAEFASIVNYKAATREQRMGIVSALKAEGALAGNSLNFDFSLEAKLEAVAKHFAYDTDYLIRGIASPPYFEPLETKSAEFCRDFLKLTPDSPIVTDLDFTDYGSVPPG